ncbi:TetR/AcrR family transcriptional regulator [Pleurocapsales cyanobacterium LEGE 10410]|nr:TetR/AcrR family transcriptional regulator [Pleurocapsales cyanobacterium LEGE 10410]
MVNNDVMKANKVTNFRVVREKHQQELRRGILDDVSNLLVQKGPNAITMRRIADTVGCSTTILYTMFRNKQGLVDELYLRGFELLRQSLAAVSYVDDLRNYIYALCLSYRDFALANPTYYSIMFLKAIAEYTPSEANLKLGQASLELLVQAIRDCITDQPEAEEEAWEIARIIWATVHGHVGLELTGYANYSKASSQQMLERALQALVNELLPTIDQG